MSELEGIADGFKGEKAIVIPYNIREYQESNEITSRLFLTHIGYYPSAKFHYFKRPKGANEYVFIYCEKGKGWIEYDEDRCILQQNSAFIIPAKEAHSYGADNRDPWSIYWLHFNGKDVDMFASIIGKVLYLKDADNSRYNDRFTLFEDMFQNLSMGYSPENLEYISYCLTYFFASIKYLNQFRQIKNVKVDDVIQQCIHFMKDNLENKISLEDIANEVGYSSSYLTNLFSQKTSYSPMIYYNQLRIQRACSYLQFSKLKIKEISFRLGFYDPFHFSNAFFKEMGISPKEYRKRYMEKNDYQL